MPHQFEAAAVEQMRDVLARACEEVVDAKHVVSEHDQPLA
jgi:hypothetical protein